MSEITDIVHVTRARGELTPTRQVGEAVNRFLEKPMNPETMKLYTAVQALYERESLRDSDQAARLRHVDATFHRMARYAFTLAKPMLLQARRDGAGQLFFSVRETDLLQEITDDISSLQTLERDPTRKNMLYVEIARGGLATDLRNRYAQMNDADAKIDAELRHPSVSYRMVARNPRLVTRDIAYPASRLTYLPDDSES